MSQRHDLLLEIGTEELPPKALDRLSEALSQGLCQGLEKAGIGFGKLERFASPRRLAVRIQRVETAQPDRRIERRGPALAAAFDDAGNPTRAAQGFAGSCGVEITALETLETKKGAWLVYRGTERGQPTTALLPEIATTSLAALPIPKRMRWGDREVEFVRPVHWVVFLLGAEIVPCQLLGVKAGRDTRGHRFHHPEAISLARPEDYPERLREPGHVIADLEQRSATIRQGVEALAQTTGGTAVIDPMLLAEVTALVEWPVPILGGFDKSFLSVPHEALISAMKGHQKYFHLVDSQGRLMPHFITVSNIDSRNPAAVREGNERVIRPRLSDSAFFWNQDLKNGLESYRQRLADVVFQKDLGSLLEKSDRVASLASSLAPGIGADPDQAHRAGALSKCDLMSEMVNEFPDLQGIMGRYYAQAAGEPETVAQALDEQYQPRFSGDALPKGNVGKTLSLADKLDTLAGIFGIGQRPTGDRDPFALRRAALGVLRILVEARIEADLEDLIGRAIQGYAPRPLADDTAATLFDFLNDRLRGYLLEHGHTPDVFQAVLAVRPTAPLDFVARMEAVQSFVGLPEAEALATANKRIGNLLRKAESKPGERVDPALLEDPAEHALFEALEEHSQAIAPLLQQAHYQQALTHLAGLRHVVDHFFDTVMVMVDDPDQRRNRLALLNRLHQLFLGVADISRLQGNAP